MELKRYQDIIAFKNLAGEYTAFHATNLEVASLSKSSFNIMAPIDLLNGGIPDPQLSSDLSSQSSENSTAQEALTALKEWNSEVNPETKDGALNFGIRSITINVNQICNLKCTYCAAGGDGTYGTPTNQISIEKTLPQLKFFLSQLKPGQKFSISFVGGEPLLHTQAVKTIYDYVQEEAKIKSIKPIMNIVTNGTLLNEKNLQLLRSMEVLIKVSLDGPKATNDIVRPSKNGQSSTDMTLEGITALNKNRGLITGFSIAAICSKENPDMVAAYRFFETLNPDFIEFNLAYAENDPSLQASYIQQMNQIAELAWKSGGEEKLRKIKAFDHYFSLLDNQQRINNHCGAGKSYLMIDANNGLYHCPWAVNDSKQSIGHGTQFNTKEIAKYSKSLIELNNCQTCWARHLCGGGCMYVNSLHNGDKHKKDLFFCERIRSLILTAIMYYKMSRG